MDETNFDIWWNDYIENDFNAFKTSEEIAQDAWVAAIQWATNQMVTKEIK